MNYSWPETVGLLMLLLITKAQQMYVYEGRPEEYEMEEGGPLWHLLQKI